MTIGIAKFSNYDRLYVHRDRLCTFGKIRLQSPRVAAKHNAANLPGLWSKDNAPSAGVFLFGCFEAVSNWVGGGQALGDRSACCMSGVFR